MNPAHSLEQVKALLEQGLKDDARALAKSRDTRNLHDANLHRRWADLLEEMGLVEEVVLELNLALRDDPAQEDAIRRLAEIYLDLSQPQKAAHLYSQMASRQPRDPRLYQDWGQALEEAGDYRQALSVYQEAKEKTGDGRFEGLIKNLGFLEEAVQEALATAPQAQQLLPQPHQLVVFTSLFAGREGMYARQWVSPNGDTGYTPVNDPLTLKVAENHILGNYTVGVYPVRLDNTVNFLAFDFDLANFALRRALTNRRIFDELIAKLHQAARRLLELAAQHQLPAYLEDSGYKGRHVWIFLETPAPAGVAKKCGTLLLSQLKPLPVEVVVEVFPKQGSVPRGGLGNLIKLPLGYHRRTGRRALFMRPDGEYVEDQLGLLETVAKASRRAVYALVQRLAGEQDRPAPQDGPEPGEEEVKPAVPLPPVQEVYDLDRDPQLQQLLLKCPALKSLVEQVHRRALLSKDETMVLVHTLGHLEHGPQIVNELFQRCLNAAPALFLKSRLRGNPMSCPKIRARAPQITAAVDCNCAFDDSVNLYPTPLIHAHTLAAAPLPLGLTVSSLSFQNLLQDYLRLRKQSHETQLLLQRYEQQLAQFFSETGMEVLQTTMGRLHYRKEPDGSAAFTLEI